MKVNFKLALLISVLSLGALNVVSVADAASAKPTSTYASKRIFYSYVHEGRLVRVSLVNKATGKILLDAYPYGLNRYSNDAVIKKHTRAGFKRFIKSRIKKDNEIRNIENSESLLKSVNLPSASMAASGVSCPSESISSSLPLGFSPSVGQIEGSTCFNAVTRLTNPQAISNYSSQSAANSFAEQYNASSEVESSAKAFNESNGKYSFSEAYQASSNSHSYYYNASAVYTATNVFCGLSDRGLQSQRSGTFSESCGSNFIDKLGLGMLATMRFTFATKSSSLSTEIDAKVSSKSGLGGITAAVQASLEASASSTSYDIEQRIIGGGQIVSSAMTLAYDEAYAGTWRDCINGTLSSCDKYGFVMNKAAQNGIADFQKEVQQTSVSRLDIVASFPAGLNGATAPALSSIPITSLMDQGSYPDRFKPYANQIKSYLNLLNQITVLKQRAKYLIDNVQQGYFNPVPLLDINQYLKSVERVYDEDSIKLSKNLTKCLFGTSQNVEVDCEEVISASNNGIRTPWDWYGSYLFGHHDTAARQNALALQYTSQTYETRDGGKLTPVPMDVVWAQTLPDPWTEYPPTYLYTAGNSALISFADQRWLRGRKNVLSSTSRVIFLVAPQGTSISTNASAYTPATFIIDDAKWQFVLSPTLIQYPEAVGAVNTFDEPLNIRSLSSGNPQVEQAITPISGFFGN